jgi:hypothetical protein
MEKPASTPYSIPANRREIGSKAQACLYKA